MSQKITCTKPLRGTWSTTRRPRSARRGRDQATRCILPGYATAEEARHGRGTGREGARAGLRHLGARGTTRGRRRAALGRGRGGAAGRGGPGRGGRPGRGGGGGPGPR